MKFNPTPTHGRLLQGDTPYGKFRVEWAADGTLISESIEIRRPPEPIPSGFDPASERQGCCDPPLDAAQRGLKDSTSN